MKKIIYVITTIVFLSLHVFAQSPQKFSYQALIRNSSNNLVALSPVGIRISILQGSISGSSVYVETHTTTTNGNGVLSIEIGSGSPIIGTLASVNWANGPYFIKTETDPTGGASYSISGTSQLLSVPYALHAKTVELENDPLFSNKFDVNGSSNGDLLKYDGTKYVKFSPNYLSSENQNLGNVISLGNNANKGSVVNLSQVGVGTSTVNPVALIELQSTTQGFLPSRMTQKQRDGISNAVAGLIVYNTTTNTPNYFDGSEWKTFDGKSATTIEVGTSFKGGIIAYVYQPSDPGYVAGEAHGLIVAPVEQGSAQWSANLTWTYATIGGIGGAALNTATIVSSIGTGTYAAQICNDLVYGGYDDWYLPTIDELQKLFAARATIGGFTELQYWSSTEANQSAAKSIYTNNGAWDYRTKYDYKGVRAIRYF